MCVSYQQNNKTVQRYAVRHCRTKLCCPQSEVRESHIKRQSVLPYTLPFPSTILTFPHRPSPSIGDSSAVRSAVRAQLYDVEAIQATRQAFAARRRDGSVVSWGSEDYGARPVGRWC